MIILSWRQLRGSWHRQILCPLLSTVFNHSGELLTLWSRDGTRGIYLANLTKSTLILPYFPLYITFPQFATTKPVSFVLSLLDKCNLLCWDAAAAAAAKSLQSCPTLCDPIEGSPPGSAIPGILQARTLEWVAISFSNTWKWKVKVKSLSRIRLFATPLTAAHQAPPSMGFSRQE